MHPIFLILLITFGFCKFPKGFKFGATTSAFQSEGAWLDEGKALSIWDNLAHLPGYIADGSAPEIAANSYYLYKDDIDLLVNAGIKHYRMSLSWPRIVPQGRNGSAINMQAIERYRQMFVLMKEKGITPYVTLYHWDLPASLFVQGYGMTDIYLIDNFKYYANVCFQHFGDLVQNWFTINEPYWMTLMIELDERVKSTKPYEIAHNILMAHAEVVKLYRDQYKEKQKGRIGIVINTEMYYPKYNFTMDKKAAARMLDFYLGWFGDPIFLGDYPKTMRERVKERLVNFTDDEMKILRNSSDFFALNHYGTYLATDGNKRPGEDYWSDVNVVTSLNKSWKVTDMGWPIVPQGFYDLIMHINQRYNLTNQSIPLIITENGMANKEPTEKEAKSDTLRIEYLTGYLGAVERAIEKGVKIEGYFIWSLLDNFEWKAGFSKRFGLVRIEYGETPKRIPKASYYWYRDFIKKNTEADQMDE